MCLLINSIAVSLISNEKEKAFLKRAISNQHLKRLKNIVIGQLQPSEIYSRNLRFFKPLLYHFTLDCVGQIRTDVRFYTGDSSILTPSETLGRGRKDSSSQSFTTESF